MMEKMVIHHVKAQTSNPGGFLDIASSAVGAALLLHSALGSVALYLDEGSGEVRSLGRGSHVRIPIAICFATHSNLEIARQ